MASAYFANKYNLKFKVYENSNFIGGNCRTIEIDNFKFDTGAHRFHDKIPHITSEIKNILKENLLEVSSPSKIILNQKPSKLYIFQTYLESWHKMGRGFLVLIRR